MTLTERLAAVDSALNKLDYSEAFEHATLLAGELKALRRVVNPQEINYLGVADAAIRSRVEPVFTAEKRLLDESYYQNWKFGRSAPYRGYDVQETPEASKALFDKLSDLVDQAMVIALDEADRVAPPEEKIPAHRKVDGEGRSLRSLAETRIAERANEGLTLDLSGDAAKVGAGRVR